LFGIFLLYSNSSYIQDSGLCKVTQLVDKSVGTKTSNTNSLVNSLSNEPYIENEKILVSDANDKFVESLTLNPDDKMFVYFDIKDKNDPLSVALRTGGENFKVTIHDVPVSEIPSVEYSKEQFLLDKARLFKEIFSD